MKEWNQVGGDVNPKDHGAILARLEPGGMPWSAGGIRGTSKANVDIVSIEPDDERGGYHVIATHFDVDDLAWGGPAKAAQIASYIGASKARWEKMSLVERAVAALGYHGAGWSGDSGHVKNWSDALPARSNQIEWWKR